MLKFSGFFTRRLTWQAQQARDPRNRGKQLAREVKTPGGNIMRASDLVRLHHTQIVGFAAKVDEKRLNPAQRQQIRQFAREINAVLNKYVQKHFEFEMDNRTYTCRLVDYEIAPVEAKNYRLRLRVFIKFRSIDMPKLWNKLIQLRKRISNDVRDNQVGVLGYMGYLEFEGNGFDGALDFFKEPENEIIEEK